MQIPSLLKEIGFNSRQMSFGDFQQICQKEQIVTIFAKASFKGVSFPRRGRVVIVLNENLSGVELLLVAWHELFHQLCGHEGVRFFLPGCLDKSERQADALSLCAVIPKTWIETKTINELLEEELTWEILWQRKQIYETYKI